MFRFLSLAILVSSLLTGGCTYFRLPVLQGNIVDYDKAEKLEIGMTPKQVEFLLGTPLIKDSFGTPRWDYVVYYRSPQRTVLQKNMSVYFADGVVSRIEGREELLADWRKQQAAIDKLKEQKELLETPHPGQFPADASKAPSDPASEEPHPVLPPSDPEVREEITEDEPEDEPPPARESSASEPEPAAAPASQPDTGSSSNSQAQPQPQPASQSGNNYPPDMTTIYK